jgi:predicted nucleic acid-binding protein
MKNLVLDTNILIHINRGKEKAQKVREYVNTLTEPQIYISVVSIAEAESLVVQWKMPDEAVKRLRSYLNKFVFIDIEQNNQTLLDAYVNIDCYSKRKIKGPNDKLIPNGAIRMKKNDLWIAATAYALDAVLLTTNGDFDHLHNLFFEVKKF